MGTTRPSDPACKNPDWSVGYDYPKTKQPHPFPGMDPFVESMKWETTHHAMAEGIAEFISPQLPDGFVISSEDSVTLLTPTEGGGGFRVGSRRAPDNYISTTQPESSVAMMTVPDDILAPDSVVENDQSPFFSVIIRGKEGEIVTWIELLSPGNKDPNGFKVYQAKRSRILSSNAALLEIDLTSEHGPLPEHDPGLGTRYYAMLNKPDDRSRFLQYGIPLRRPMRTLKVPVTNATVDLDLQEVFNRIYARRQLEKSLDYNDIKKCHLEPTDEIWAHQCIETWRSAGNRDMPLRQPRKPNPP